MNTWARKSFKVGVLSAGMLLFAGTAANADWNSVGNSGVLSGNQVGATVQAPINISGNAVGVVGNSEAESIGGSWADLGSDSSPNRNSFGNSGIGSGNQVGVTVQAPIDVCGNAVGVFGNTGARCVGGSSATDGTQSGPWSMNSTHNIARTDKAGKNTESAHVTEAAPVLNSGLNSGILSGNQVNAVVQAPIDVCGNAIGLLGNAQASCIGGASASTDGADAPVLNSGLNSGILSGNQVNGLVQIPINVCGNAIGIFGNTQASCAGGSSATTGGGGDYGNDLFGGSAENATAVKATKAVKADKTVTADHTTNGMSGYNPGGGSGGGGNWGGSGSACSPVMNSFLNSGFLSGNQVNLVAQAPIEISGNAIGVLGNAQAWSIGGASANC